MITRMPSAQASSLAFDVCPLGAEAPSLSIELLQQGFLALDHHGQLDMGRALKRQLRERLVEQLDAQLPAVAAAALARSTPQPRALPQRRSRGG
ncbi:hypothetical protein RCF34_17210 [Pseudomonas sp. 102515]|uniref:hypothetical protein n=1 Tax=Pseudomonas sp. 102515 TaxID=3071568 RepID=UPI002801CD2C|nr:hypothetical protein [Pseudomonas sp. 102515]MDQ7914851.1 hypothetical protein [Pseudomonas sp. 102515]